MNGIQFTKTDGGLVRKLEGQTHISGLIVYGEPGQSMLTVYSADELEEAGVTSATHPVTHYHTSEFFRMNPGAKLYVETVLESDGLYDEVKVMQNASGGEIRQFGVCDFLNAAMENAVTRLNEIAQEFWNENMPIRNIMFSGKVTAETMTALLDLHTLNSEYVSVILGQDGGGYGGYLAGTYPSLSCIGAALGTLSAADLHESIGWVEKFNLVSTAYPKVLTGGIDKARELDVPAFCDGSLIGSYTKGQIQAIHDKGYIFPVALPGIVGRYFNDCFTATDLQSDFAYSPEVGVVSEAARAVYKVLTPKISGPIYVDPDTGYIDAGNASALEGFCDDVLQEMKNAGQISGFSVYIAPNQQVLRTSKLKVILKIVPVGTLREITVEIGLTTNT